MIYREVCTVYGVPSDDMPWTLFCLLATSVASAQLRRLHDTMIGTMWGAAMVIGGKRNGQLELMERKVRTAAYPQDGPSDVREFLMNEAAGG